MDFFIRLCWFPSQFEKEIAFKIAKTFHFNEAKSIISNHSINCIIPLEIQHQWFWNLIWSRVGTSIFPSFFPSCLLSSFPQKLKLLFYHQLYSWLALNPPPRHIQNCLTPRWYYTKRVLTGPLRTEVPGRQDTKPEDADIPHFLSTSLRFLRTPRRPQLSGTGLHHSWLQVP